MKKLIQEFEKYLVGEKNAAKNTVSAYLNDLKQFEVFLRETGHACNNSEIRADLIDRLTRLVNCPFSAACRAATAPMYGFC